MSVTQSIQDAIKQNLPAAVAGELATFIEQANKDKKGLADAQLACANVNKELAETRLENSRLTEKLKAYADLEAREKAVQVREAALDITLAENNRDRSLDMANSIYKLAEIAFRNPRIVHTESGQLPYNGGGQLPGSGYVQLTRTTEEMK